jgi:hypothetical protein
MVTFLLGVLIGSLVGLTIIVICIAGKKEGALRDEMYYKV